MKKYDKKFLVLITNTLSELDVLFPLFAGMKKEYNVKVEMLITVSKIHAQYESNDFYKYCAKELNIKINKCQLPNKFDYRKGIFIKKPVTLLINLYFIILKIIKFPYLIPKLILSNVFMHEYSNQIGSTYILYLYKRYFSKKIYTYIHGQSFNQVGKNSRKVQHAEKSLLLLWHENNRPLVNSLGYSNIHLIGMTKFFREWIYYINEYSKLEFNKKIVLIYTRSPKHKFYMDENMYTEMLLTSYRAIRAKLSDITIVLKLHPREDKNFAESLIRTKNLKNILISNEHAGVLAKNALFVISFWTSAILDSLSLGVPSVEYYKEPKNFRITEPKGSMYKKLGISSVESETDLVKFIESVMNQSYKMPDVIKEIDKIKDYSFVKNA